MSLSDKDIANILQAEDLEDDDEMLYERSSTGRNVAKDLPSIKNGELEAMTSQNVSVNPSTTSNNVVNGEKGSHMIEDVPPLPVSAKHQQIGKSGTKRDTEFLLTDKCDSLSSLDKG